MSTDQTQTNNVVRLENKVVGLVYFGAAFLIIMIGLRGLGKVVGESAIIPSFMIDENGKLSTDWVFGALFLEFTLLVLMSIITFLKPVHDEGEAKSFTPKNLLSQLDVVEKETQKKVESIDRQIKKMEEINKRINRIQEETVNHINRLHKIV